MTTGVEIAVRARRAAFNRAIADRDASAIGPILARDCVMITGTDSAVVAGRMAQVKLWRREFVSPQSPLYTRLPDVVLASPVEPIAMETGVWQGADRETGVVTSSGTYAAKWREVAGIWVMEAEFFVTLS